MRATVTLLRRPLRWWGASLVGVGTAAALVAMLGSFVRTAWPTEPMTIGAAALAALAWSTLGLLWPRAPRTREGGVELALMETHCHVGARSLPRASIARALLVESGEVARVQLHLPSRVRMPIEVEFASVDEAKDFVRALGFAADQRVAPFVALSPLDGWRGYGFAFVAVLLFVLATTLISMVALSSYLPLVFAFLLLLPAAATTAATHVDVGADGLAWRWLGKRRFVPWTRVLAARSVPVEGRSTVGAVEIDIDGEGTQRFTLGLDEVGTDTPERLLARIEQARASRSGGPRAHASLDLGANTDIVAQLAKVKRLATETTEYRTGALAPERAEALLADPHAPPASRAVAAVALIASSPVEGRRRVRIAAEGTADRNLRAALEAAAGEDEALLAEKLGVLRMT